MKSPLYRLLTFSLVLLFACHSQKAGNPLPDDGTSALFQAASKPFYHGIASGDPLHDRVIIWSRITPDREKEVEVEWAVANDKNFQQIVKKGKVTTSKANDYTIKVDVIGLLPDTYYYYRFTSGKSSSAIGRTKTSPANHKEQVRLIIASCSNFEAGFFNAYARIAEKENVDAVLHLGDYIYEYQPKYYGDSTTGRFHLPAKELISLSDYRTRYAQYHLDRDLQKAHQMHPFITIWDDHEISNNSYKDGAQNHQPDKEGDYMARKEAAKKAYYEWLPVREQANHQLYRRLHFGTMVDLFMLDERLAGRSAQVDSFTQASLNDPSRAMLGKEQMDWLTRGLTNSDADWKILGNQVIFANLRQEFIWPKRPVNLDAWDGYPAERQRLLDFLHTNNIKNTIFVTGDTHNSWAFEIPYDMTTYRDGRAPSLAVELGTPSITSANYDSYTSMDTVKMLEQAYRAPNFNPHLKYVNLSEHGYILLDLTPAEAHAQWYHMDKINKVTQKETMAMEFWIKNGSGGLDKKN